MGVLQSCNLEHGGRSLIKNLTAKRRPKRCRNKFSDENKPRYLCFSRTHWAKIAKKKKKKPVFTKCLFCPVVPRRRFLDVFGWYSKCTISVRPSWRYSFVLRKVCAKRPRQSVAQVAVSSLPHSALVLLVNVLWRAVSMTANDQLGQKPCGTKSGRPFRHRATASPSLFDAVVDPMDGTCWTSRRDDAWRAAFRRDGPGCNRDGRFDTERRPVHPFSTRLWSLDHLLFMKVQL